MYGHCTVAQLGAPAGVRSIALYCIVHRKMLTSQMVQPEGQSTCCTAAWHEE
jgi:hypothetical protein